MRISYENQVRDATVVDSTGRAVGSVVALFIDTGALPDRLAVESLRVRLRNDVADELGIGHGAFRHATIDVPAHAVQGIGDAVVLGVPVRSLLTDARDAAPEQPSS